MIATTRNYDVIVVGAGPVGLLLSCELGLAGISVLVLEREESNDNPWKSSPLGFRGLHVPSVEALYRRGLLDKVFRNGKGPRTSSTTEGFQYAGHFAGIPIDGNKIDFSRWKNLLPGPAASGAPVVVGALENVFAERARELGVDIQRGVSVSRMLDEGDSVKVWAGETTFEAQWLVGCDGGRSYIRKAAGFEFAGTEAEMTGYAAVCDLDKPHLLKTSITGTDAGVHFITPWGSVLVFDFDKGAGASATVTESSFQSLLRRVSKTDIAVNKLYHISTFTDRSKQATQYRKGRVLLAGDSAHIHPPLGAQGLNCGLGDAMNLGWKLAATIKGTAGPGLLDTYHQERYPVGQGVLDWNRAQVETLRPGPSGKALMKLMRILADTDGGAAHFLGSMWGLDLQYDLGEGQHELVGRSAPDFECHDSTRLGPRLSHGRFVLVDLEEDPGMERVARSMGPEIEYVGIAAKDALGVKALLLRPDAVVAWASYGDRGSDGLREAFSRWTQAPA